MGKSTCPWQDARAGTKEAGQAMRPSDRGEDDGILSIRRSLEGVEVRQGQLTP